MFTWAVTDGRLSGWLLLGRPILEFWIQWAWHRVLTYEYNGLQKQVFAPTYEYERVRSHRLVDFAHGRWLRIGRFGGILSFRRLFGRAFVRGIRRRHRDGILLPRYDGRDGVAIVFFDACTGGFGGGY